MHFSIGIASETRAFGKAMRRIRPGFDALVASFAAQPLAHPIHEFLLVGLTNSQPLGFLEEAPNRDGAFQVLCGLGPWEHGPERDAELRRMAWDAVRRSIEACPFSAPDRAAFAHLLADEERRAFAGT